MMFTTFFNMVAEHLSQGAMMLQQAGWTKVFPWSMMVFMSVREVCASNLQNLQHMAEQTVAEKQWCPGRFEFRKMAAGIVPVCSAGFHEQHFSRNGVVVLARDCN